MKDIFFDKLMRPNIFKRNKIRDDLFFIHIMKTAGTSFRKMLINEFGEESVYPNDTNLSQLPNGWYPSTKWISENYDQIRKHKILIGHFPYSLFEKLNHPYKVITFLREPFSRTISMINHRKLNTPEYATLTFEELLDKEDFVKSQILNFQTKVFGMPLGEVKSPSETNQQTLEIAISRLRKVEFIGISEQFMQSCQLFDKKFSTSMSKNIRSDNILKKGEEISERLLNKIKPLINLDLELYNEATRLFNAEKVKNGITD
jgi:hypothetical protein